MTEDNQSGAELSSRSIKAVQTEKRRSESIGGLIVFVIVTWFLLVREQQGLFGVLLLVTGAATCVLTTLLYQQRRDRNAPLVAPMRPASRVTAYEPGAQSLSGITNPGLPVETGVTTHTLRITNEAIRLMARAGGVDITGLASKAAYELVRQTVTALPVGMSHGLQWSGKSDGFQWQLDQYTEQHMASLVVRDNEGWYYSTWLRGGLPDEDVEREEVKVWGPAEAIDRLEKWLKRGEPGFITNEPQENTRPGGLLV
jgi:hypothetical protein